MSVTVHTRVLGHNDLQSYDAKGEFGGLNVNASKRCDIPALRNKLQHVVDYVPLSKEKPKYVWNQSCFSVDAPTRTRGRVWIDRFGGDVLRIDETMAGPLDVERIRSEDC